MTYQQTGPKRRRTNEMTESQAQTIRPVLAAPAAPKQVLTRPIYAQGYAPVSQQGTQPAASKYSVAAHASTGNNRAAHPMDMSKYAAEKIPFAPSSKSHLSQSQRPTQGQYVPNVQVHKSSPAYRNGDDISLPDIPSDSEGDDSDVVSVASWVNSPALRETLLQQQMIEPESIFGAVAPLHMEKIFENTERHHRFRGRTSSANWTGQDRLTIEEIQKDLRSREKLMRDGAWTYGNYGS
jgi:hypothetical protein